FGINAAGEIIGSYDVSGAPKAFIWRGSLIHNLNDQLALKSDGANWWDLTDARAINEESQIVGFGTINSETHAFRLDPLPFTVTDPNLVLWLRADTGVVKDANDLVSKWEDQSFNGNDLEQTDANYQPLFISDISCCNPLIRFDGSDDYLSEDSYTYDGNSTIFMVVRTTNDPNGALFASENVSSEPNAFEIRVADVNLQLCTGTTPDIEDIAPAAREFVIFEVVISDTNVSFYKNGRHLKTTALSTDEAKRYTDFILGKSRAGVFLEYDIAEVLVFEGALSDTRRQEVEDYLTNKHELYGPVDMGQPLLWLSADAGVTVDSNDADPNEYISLWADQSGYGHDASQSDPCNQPIWESGVFDCTPAVSFTGSFMSPNTPAPIYPALAGMICLDRSESMLSTSVGDPNSTRFDEAKEAIIAFLEQVRDDDISGDYAGFMVFHGSVDISSYSGETFTQDINSIIADVNDESPQNGNGTNFKQPLQNSNNKFTDYQETLGDREKRIILITDGLAPNQNIDLIMRTAQDSKDLGIKIHTIFIPFDTEPAVTRQVLQDISDLTGGTYHEVSDETELTGVFLEIFDIIMAGTYGNTLFTVFKTGSDVSSRQVLFAEGDPNVGLNLYIDSNELYFSAWDLETAVSGTTWGPNNVHTAIEANSTYSATLVYNFNDRLEAYLNGGAFDTPTVSVGKLPPHARNHSVGGNPSSTRFHDGNDPNSYYYVGHVAETLYYESALSASTRATVDLYLSDRYGFEIRYNLPPVPDPNGDITVVDYDSDGVADVNLSGYAYDDGGDANLTYQWYDEDGNLLTTGKNPTIEFDVGTHIIELRITDEDGDTSVDIIVVTVTTVISDLKSTSLLLHLTFNEDANDSSGNTFDANVVNANEPNCWIEGKSDEAIKLIADNNEYVDLNPDGNTVDYLPGGSSARTIMGWFEAGDNNEPTFFDYGTVDANEEGSRFAITASSTRLAVTIGSYSHTMGVQLTNPITGWHHITVVFPEGATRSDQVKIFLDGVQQVISTLDNSGDPVTVNTNTWDPNAYAYIGRDWQGNYFDGGIDDVRIYARALDNSEIPVTNASQTSYHVVDLGLLEPNQSPQAGEGWAINNQGNIIGRTTVFLEPNTTYYWRIDEKNGCGTTKGDVWNFTTGSAAAELVLSEFAKAPALGPVPIGDADTYPDSDSAFVWTSPSVLAMGQQPNDDLTIASAMYAALQDVETDNNPGNLSPEMVELMEQLPAPQDMVELVLNDGEWTFSEIIVSSQGCDPPPELPPAPQFEGPNNSCHSLGSITLNWTHVGTDYYVEWGIGSFSNWDYPTPSYKSIQATTPGALYKWHVKAHNDAGWGPWSSTWYFKTDPNKASSPSPTDNATDVSEDANLSWTAGSGATSHDVYFGTTSPGTFQGNQAATTYDPGTMDSNTVYYWKIDEVSEYCTREGDIWQFTTVCPEPNKATDPDVKGPAGEPNTIDSILYWTPGNLAESHDVYFGTDFNDVNDATTSSAEYMGNVDVNHFDTRTIHAFARADLNMTALTSLGELATPDFNSWAEAFGLSGSGNIVGVSYDENFNPHAVIWEVNSVSGYDLSDLHTLGDANESVAYDITDANWIVGRVDANAFILKDPNDPNMIILPGIASETDNNSVARAITNGTDDLPSIAVGWSGGKAVYWNNLDTNEPNVHLLDWLGVFLNSKAYGLNEYRQIVGYRYPRFGDPNEHRAFIGDIENGLTNIGTLEQGDISRAYGINNSGQVVGEATIDSNDNQIRGFIYDNGQLRNLNNLLQSDANDPNWVIISARSINDDGYITGYGTTGDPNDPNNYYRAILLVPARPISHWQFDETDGDVAMDISVRGNHAEPNGAAWTSGIIRGALGFDGADDYAITQSMALDPNKDNFTVTLWIKPDVNDSNQVLISQANGDGTGTSWLKIDSNGKLSTELSGVVDSNGTTLATGTWYHVAMTKSSNQVSFYLDGSSDGDTDQAIGDVASATGEMIFGSNKTRDDDFFDGVMDDVRIYLWALSPSEVMEIFEE
ncbi:MAG: LamG-like jellyroll fold domain-containing protein, partial [Planctomycetota bacterium]